MALREHLTTCDNPTHVIIRGSHEASAGCPPSPQYSSKLRRAIVPDGSWSRTNQSKTICRWVSFISLSFFPQSDSLNHLSIHTVHFLLYPFFCSFPLCFNVPHNVWPFDDLPAEYNSLIHNGAALVNIDERHVQIAEQQQTPLKGQQNNRKDSKKQLRNLNSKRRENALSPKQSDGGVVFSDLLMFSYLFSADLVFTVFCFCCFFALFLLCSLLCCFSAFAAFPLHCFCFCCFVFWLGSFLLLWLLCCFSALVVLLIWVAVWSTVLHLLLFSLH